MNTSENNTETQHNGSIFNGAQNSTNPKQDSSVKMNTYEELSLAAKKVYESYLELLNYKAKNLLLTQFFRDLYVQTALGFGFLALFFATAAGIWGLSDRINPVMMALIVSGVFLLLAGFFVWKGFFSKKMATRNDGFVDEELQRIQQIMTQESRNLSESISNKESQLLDQINPVEIITQKVKDHPSLSIGAALLVGLFTAYQSTRHKA